MDVPVPHIDDSALFRQIADGDEAAFTRLFERYVVKIGSFVASISNSEKIVDEVIQETFLRVWMNRDKLPEIREPKAWLFRIAANICYTWRNRLLLENKFKEQAYRNSPGSHNEVSELFYLNALKMSIAEAVNLLSPQRRKIFQLNRNDGFTVTEISEYLSLSPQTVRNTLSSSMELVRDYLRKKGYSLVLIGLLLHLL